MMKSDQLSLRGLEGCEKLKGKGYRGVFWGDGNVPCLVFVVVYVGVYTIITTHRMDYFIVCKLYLDKKLEEEKEEKRKERGRDGGWTVGLICQPSLFL